MENLEKREISRILYNFKNLYNLKIWCYRIYSINSNYRIVFVYETIQNNSIVSQLLRVNQRFLHEYRKFIDLKYLLFPLSLVPLFVSLSSGNTIIDVVPKSRDKVAQLIPFANNFLSLSLSLSMHLSLIVSLSCISLYLPTQIIITMVGTAWQTMLCEILGILDCYGNKLRSLTNEKSCCFKNKIYGMQKYLFNLIFKCFFSQYETFFDRKCSTLCT